MAFMIAGAPVVRIASVSAQGCLSQPRFLPSEMFMFSQQSRAERPSIVLYPRHYHPFEIQVDASEHVIVDLAIIVFALTRYRGTVMKPE